MGAIDVKIKILLIGITLLIISGALIGNSKGTFVEKNSELNTVEVNIAMLCEDRMWEAMDLAFFKDMLIDYAWIVGDTEYVITVDLIMDKDILNGYLNINNHEMLIVAGGAIGDTEAFVRCKPNLENKRWKNNIANFIKDGGGYFSVCGGTALITDLDLDRKPKSGLEYAYEYSSIGVSCVKSHYTTCADPLFSQLFGLPPEYSKAVAYCLYTGWNYSDFNQRERGGLCQDIKINRSHPIFDDYLKDTRRIRWIGGPWLKVPDNPDREVSVLATHPEEEMSDNESTRMYVWEYTGGISGLIKGIFKSLKDLEHSWFSNPLYGGYTHAEDWTRTDKVMETDFSNKPALTAEIYPNSNKGRIVLSGPHTERNVWWGGYWEEVEDHDHNNLFNAFYHWKNITENPLEYEWTYNYWLNRRCITWAAKVPNDALPPVYGPSQICDFEDNVDSLDFTVFGNSKTADGVVSLELYYRHSNDNENWSDYILFGTDDDISDGISWEFHSPDGSGYYQFYSIRIVDYEGYIETERVPPGADAMVFVEVD
jgi:hypothetical protein